jgi:hypothetical protein
MSQVVSQAKDVGSNLNAVASTVGRAAREMKDASRASREGLADLAAITAGGQGLGTRGLQHLRGLMTSQFMPSGKTLAEGYRSMASSPEATIREMLRSTGPIMGPILTTLMDRVSERSEIQARGQRGVLSFLDRGLMGGTGDLQGYVEGQGGRVAAETERLKQAFLIERPEEVNRVLESMAESGLKYDEAWEDAGQTFKGFGKSVWQVSLGLDKGLGLAVGTSARLNSEFMKASNEGLQSSLGRLVDLGKAAGSTSLGFSGLVGVISQASSAFSLQGGRVGDLSARFFQLRKTVKESLGFGDKSDIRVDELAKTAFSGLTQSLANLPKPVQGALAKQVMAGMGFNPDAVSAYRAMQGMSTGFQFGFGAPAKSGMSFQEATLAAVIKTFNLGDKGTSAEDRVATLTQITQMPALAAELVAQMLEKGGGKLSQRELAQAIEKGNKLSEDAAKVGPLTIGAFDKQMEKIKQLMNAISDAMLSVLKVMVKTLGAGFEALVLIAANPLGDKSQIARSFGIVLSDAGADLGKAFTNVVEKGKGVVKEFGSGLNLTGVTERSGLGMFLPNPDKVRKENFSDYVGRFNIDENPNISLNERDALHKLISNLRKNERGVDWSVIAKRFETAFNAAARDNIDRAGGGEVFVNVSFTQKPTKQSAVHPRQ